MAKPPSITNPSHNVNEPARITLLGSTGSIGTQVLDVVARFPDRFRIESLAAGNNLHRLAQQIQQFQPRAVAISSTECIEDLKTLLRNEAPGFTGEILAGSDALDALCVADNSNTVVVALVGMIGLSPTLKALKAGKKVLTANKETFVAGGHLVQPYLHQLLPIDSEHVAIHQCLKNERSSTVDCLYLTASGGPFLNVPVDELRYVSRQQALQHPNWVMGPKITIDSATMMNKGLEVIEAHWLFGLDYDQIKILVHPQSIIHGCVAFVDGSIMAQMGAPNMHVPIQYALGYPDRLDAIYGNSRLNLLNISSLNFQPPDEERFPCIRLAYEAGRMGSSATAVLNAANEVAVELFLADRIDYIQIPQLLEETLNAHHTFQKSSCPPSLEEITALDDWARGYTNELACLRR